MPEVAQGIHCITLDSQPVNKRSSKCRQAWNFHCLLYVSLPYTCMATLPVLLKLLPLTLPVCCSWYCVQGNDCLNYQGGHIAYNLIDLLTKLTSSHLYCIFLKVSLLLEYLLQWGAEHHTKPPNYSIVDHSNFGMFFLKVEKVSRSQSQKSVPCGT